MSYSNIWKIQSLFPVNAQKIHSIVKTVTPAKLKFIEIKIYYFNILQMVAALFDASEFTQYDPTQEPIFPSELQVKKFIS